MAKRVRTRLRFDEFYGLALVSHQQGWPSRRKEEELEILIEKNYDLGDVKAIKTAKDEFRTMAQPRLKDWLPVLRDLAEKRMGLEPAGTTKRFNHEMVKFCRRAGKDGRGPALAIKEIEDEVL